MNFYRDLVNIGPFSLGNPGGEALAKAGSPLPEKGKK